jgi:hypothetical protein
MSIEDTIDFAHEDTCAVCGRGLRPSEAIATLYRDGRRLLVCCPLCLEAYEKEPTNYLERLIRRAELRDLHHRGNTPEP